MLLFHTTQITDREDMTLILNLSVRNIFFLIMYPLFTVQTQGIIFSSAVDEQKNPSAHTYILNGYNICAILVWKRWEILYIQLDNSTLHCHLSPLNCVLLNNNSTTNNTLTVHNDFSQQSHISQFLNILSQFDIQLEIKNISLSVYIYIFVYI